MEITLTNMKNVCLWKLLFTLTAVESWCYTNSFTNTQFQWGDNRMQELWWINAEFKSSLKQKWIIHFSSRFICFALFSFSDRIPIRLTTAGVWKLFSPIMTTIFSPRSITVCCCYLQHTRCTDRPRLLPAFLANWPVPCEFLPLHWHSLLFFSSQQTFSFGSSGMTATTKLQSSRTSSESLRYVWETAGRSSGALASEETMQPQAHWAPIMLHCRQGGCIQCMVQSSFCRMKQIHKTSVVHLFRF